MPIFSNRLAEAEWLIREMQSHEGAEGWSANLAEALDRFWSQPHPSEENEFILRKLLAEAEKERDRLEDVVNTLSDELDMAEEEGCDVDNAIMIIENERESERTYLRNLLDIYVKRYCDPVPEWKPLPDMIGMLTQIDNAITITADFKARADRAEAELAQAREALEQRKPMAWVIPGDDNARADGSIDAMAWREGEFTVPLYTLITDTGRTEGEQK